MRTTIHKQLFHTPAAGSGVAMADMHAAFAAQHMYCALSWRFGVQRADIPEKKNARSRNYGPFKTKNKKHEAKIINYLEFDTICITNNNIVIDWAMPGMEANEQLRIGRADFEQWLYKTCRLDWCLTELISGEHQLQPTYEWIYAHYGISLNDLKTYMAEQWAKG